MRLQVAANFRPLLFCILLFAPGCNRSSRNTRLDLPELCGPQLELAESAVRTLNTVSGGFYTPQTLKKTFQAAGDRARQFIGLQCAVYSDDQTALSARLSVLAGLHKLKEGRPQSFDKSQPLWPQLTAEGYRDLIAISDRLAHFRWSRIKTQPAVVPGVWIEPPIDPLSVCEIRFIFEKYLVGRKNLLSAEDFALYESSLALHSEHSCDPADKDSFYFYRGDSGLVPTMYEARTMNFAQYNYLKSPNLYRSAPAAMRLQGSLSILRAELFYPHANHAHIADTEKPVIFFSTALTHPAAPFYILEGSALNSSNAAADKELAIIFKSEEAAAHNGAQLITATLWNEHYSSAPDQGFSRIFATASLEGRKLAWARMSAVFNRHVGYYSTKLTSPDGSFFTDRVSPWLSTSAYPHQSHKFTFFGYNQEKERGDKLHWLTVFHVKRENMYGSAELLAGKPIDFSRTWFNEQSFATDTRAKKELAWDHFASAPAQDIEALLLLDDIAPPVSGQDYSAPPQ